MAMDMMTDEDVWATLYNFAFCCAGQTEKFADDLMWLIAEEQEAKSKQM